MAERDIDYHTSGNLRRRERQGGATVKLINNFSKEKMLLLTKMGRSFVFRLFLVGNREIWSEEKRTKRRMGVCCTHCRFEKKRQA